MGNWFADRLGIAAPPQAPQPQQYQQPVQQPQYQQPQQYHQPTPGVAQVQAPAGFKAPPVRQYDPNDPNRPITYEELQAYNVPPGSSQEMIRMAVAMARTGGTRAVKQYENQPCPECGSHLYFTRSHPSLAKTNANGQRCSPAPRCEECGYNGLFVQYAAAAGGAPGGPVAIGTDPGDGY